MIRWWKGRGAVVVEEGVVSRLTGCLVMSLYIPQQVIWVMDSNDRGVNGE